MGFIACDKKGEADILMVQGQCEINTGNSLAAATSFEKALLLYLKIQHIEGICDARIQLALAYLKYIPLFLNFSKSYLTFSSLQETSNHRKQWNSLNYCKNMRRKTICFII